VSGNVSVEAVLIPAKIANTVFGKYVANNYAVIALTISNRSSDDSLIVHSIFIDYNQWLLSGGSVVTQGNPLQKWQAQNVPNQIDSIETRIVRGQLLDKQPWTTRNWVLRALQAVGSVATAFTFTISSQSWIHGIGAYNGQGIPAAQTFWPDATVGQMNRISDFGFSVNKVVAKQSSDIVVAFFPIDRFISPGLKSLFISSPSVFFAPFVMLTDKTVSKDLKNYVANVVPADPEGKNLIAHLNQVEFDPDACTPDKLRAQATAGSLELACQTAEILNRLSLNTVRVIVSGTMTVDVNKVPPQITSVDIEPPANVKAEDMWKSKGTFTGTIHGSFLGGATPTILNVETSVLAIKRVDAGSTESELHFTLDFSGTLPKDTNKLTFQVSKASSEGATIKSATYDYPIQTVVPQITSVQLDSPGDKNLAANQLGTYTGTINGSFLGGTTPDVLNVDKSIIAVKQVDEKSTDTALRFTLALSSKLPEGTKKLTFQVSKLSTEGAITKSATYDYQIQTK
jgi:hypothetical protein